MAEAAAAATSTDSATLIRPKGDEDQNTPNYSHREGQIRDDGQGPRWRR